MKRWKRKVRLAVGGAAVAALLVVVVSPRIYGKPKKGDAASPGQNRAGTTMVNSRAGQVGVGGGDRASQLREEACQVCHSFDREKPSESCMTCHSGPKVRIAQQVKAAYGDVAFPHAKHATIPPKKCPALVEKKTEFRLGKQLLSMEQCLKCHAEQGASQECQSCHRVQRKDVKPSSHVAGFDRAHGDLSEMGNARCAVCHERNFCQDCHLEKEPQNHTLVWKKRAHGRLAMIDRSSCKTCHRTDFCVDCHAEICPYTLRIGWYSRPWTSQCRDCHVPGGHGGCIVCAGACSMCHQETLP